MPVLDELVPAIESSPLALDAIRLELGETIAVGGGDLDTLLYAYDGAGSLELGTESAELEARTAAIVLAGETGAVTAGPSGLELVRATVSSSADRHAPLGRRETVVSLEDAARDQATGSRSFQILFGPYNGSIRATLFAGFVPPGKAPWHYHLYDEIVWIPDGPGRLLSGDRVVDLSAGSAFRLRPREVHIVENADADREMTLIGIFTPAGSPSAAYLTPDVAAEYQFSG